MPIRDKISNVFHRGNSDKNLNNTTANTTTNVNANTNTANPRTYELPAEPVIATTTAPLSSTQTTTNTGLVGRSYELPTEPVVAPLASTHQSTYIQSENRGSIGVVRSEPTIIETIQKDVVVHERIHPVEKEEIQPIIYREREQLDVKQVTQLMHETQIQPTLFEQRELAAEVREAVVERGAPIQENIILPTTQRDATLRTQQIHAPIIEETIRKTIIEEVQPVLERDVFVPTIVQNTQPIYEKIVEAPTVTREVRNMRELGTRNVEVAPVYAAPIVQRELVQQPPIVEHVTMSTTTTTTDSFIPAKLIQEGELRNYQPAAPLNSHRV